MPTPLDHTDDSIFKLLCRINVEQNYVGNILKLKSKGKEVKEEEIEDLSLFGTFIVRTSKAFSPRIKQFAQSRRTFATYQEIMALQRQYPGDLRKELKHIKEDITIPIKERLQLPTNRSILPLGQRLEILETRLINLSKLSRDGATFFDDRVVSKYVKIDGTLQASLRGFNLLYHEFFGDRYDDFEDLEPHFFPPTFSDSAGRDIQVGVKSANALGAALVLNGESSMVESYLCKTTEYGTTGIGKVVRMYWDKPYSLAEQLGVELKETLGKGASLGKLVFEEFFLYRVEDLRNLKDAPARGPTAQEILHPSLNVVGILRRYETGFTAPFLGMELCPRLASVRYISGQEIGLRQETLETLAKGNGNQGSYTLAQPNCLALP